MSSVLQPVYEALNFSQYKPKLLRVESQLIVLYVSNMINLLIDILETVKRRITFIISFFIRMQAWNNLVYQLPVI